MLESVSPHLARTHANIFTRTHKLLTTSRLLQNDGKVKAVSPTNTIRGINSPWSLCQAAQAAFQQESRLCPLLESRICELGEARRPNVPKWPWAAFVHQAPNLNVSHAIYAPMLAQIHLHSDGACTRTRTVIGHQQCKTPAVSGHGQYCGSWRCWILIGPGHKLTLKTMQRCLRSISAAGTACYLACTFSIVLPSHPLPITVARSLCRFSDWYAALAYTSWCVPLFLLGLILLPPPNPHLISPPQRLNPHLPNPALSCCHSPSLSFSVSVSVCLSAMLPVACLSSIYHFLGHCIA